MGTPLPSRPTPSGPARVLLATLAVLLGVGAVVAAARGGAPAVAAAVAEIAPLPERLADTGLYEDLASRRLAPGVLPFAPQYPLWTDGARKARWISLPPGTSIDARDPDAWDFPVGTKLWKEFAFERRIETRYLERVADGTWRFAAYLWAPDEGDAVLAPAAGVRRATESRPGVPYDVPGRADCLVCHGNRATPVLGFSALQLSPDRDPLAPHAEAPSPDHVDLPALARRGLLRGLRPDLLERPPRIEAATPRGRAALGWLHANCGTCHTAAGPLAGLDLRLDARLGSRGDLAAAIATSAGRESRWRMPGAVGGPSHRLVPGDPERSAIVRRAATRNPFVQMPPLGTHAVDEEGVALLEAWVREDLAPAAPSDRPTTSLETVR